MQCWLEHGAGGAGVIAGSPKDPKATTMTDEVAQEGETGSGRRTDDFYER